MYAYTYIHIYTPRGTMMSRIRKKTHQPGHYPKFHVEIRNYFVKWILHTIVSHAQAYALPGCWRYLKKPFDANLKNSFGIAHRVMDIGFERHLGFRANSKPKRTKMSMASIAFIAPVYLHRKAPKILRLIAR